MKKPYALPHVLWVVLASTMGLSAFGMSPLWQLKFDGNPQPDGNTYAIDAFIGSPAIASNGTVYIAGAWADSSGNRRLYAIKTITVNGVPVGTVVSGWRKQGLLCK